MAKEIERKFLITEFPDALIREGDKSYLARDDTQEPRVRKIKDLASRAIPLTKIRTTADWSGTTVEIDTYDQVAK